MRPLILAAVLTLFGYPSFSQFKQTELKFVKYLLDKKMVDDAILVLNEKLQHPKRADEIDSINYLLGKTYYGLQNLSRSNEYLAQVSFNNPSLYRESTYLRSFNHAYLKKYNEAEHILTAYKDRDSTFSYLMNFQLSGLALLRNNLAQFDSLKKLINKSHIEIVKQQENFDHYRSMLMVTKKKSAFKAGVLSAIVPGLGRIYAGKKATGIYSIIAASLLAVQAYEGYVKDGATSTRFILYGSIFTAFYIGNIWGSTLTVKMIRNEKQEAIQQQILLDMHIPLRSIFK